MTALRTKEGSRHPPRMKQFCPPETTPIYFFTDTHMNKVHHWLQATIFPHPALAEALKRNIL
jgi:hypothetical protein